jgi:hypothetical protein
MTPAEDGLPWGLGTGEREISSKGATAVAGRRGGVPEFLEMPMVKNGRPPLPL